MEASDSLSLVALLLLQRRRRRKQSKNYTRRFWVRPWINRRKELGVFSNLIKEIESEDPETFRQFHRVDIDQFKEILHKVRPFIEKENTVMRESISPAERLAATFRFLATGESFRSLSFQFRIGERTLSQIVIETCHAIYAVMKHEYLKMPATADEWVEVADGFKSKWNYPNCIGAIDGKHFAIRQPPDTGSEYYNYKHFFSVLMLALVDSDYKFMYVNVGAPGRAGDAGVFAECSLKESLIKDKLNLPPPGNVSGMPLERLPYHIIGDDAFPMSTSLLKPFPQRNLDREKRIFNYRFSRARRTVENAFGIMANRFRVFLSPVNLVPGKVVWLILASCTLHNFLVDRNRANYLGSAVDTEETTTGIVQPGSWRTDRSLPEMQPIPGRNASQQAKHQRDQLAKYFSSEQGSVPWQEKMITVPLGM